eukprot:scaffold31970_cov31-Tisochrysis_lutea.AAC.5
MPQSPAPFYQLLAEAARTASPEPVSPLKRELGKGKGGDGGKGWVVGRSTSTLPYAAHVAETFKKIFFYFDAMPPTPSAAQRTMRSTGPWASTLEPSNSRRARSTRQHCMRSPIARTLPDSPHRHCSAQRTKWNLRASRSKIKCSLVSGFRTGHPTYQNTHPSRNPRIFCGGASSGTNTTPSAAAARRRDSSIVVAVSSAASDPAAMQ